MNSEDSCFNKIKIFCTPQGAIKSTFIISIIKLLKQLIVLYQPIIMSVDYY